MKGFRVDIPELPVNDSVTKKGAVMQSKCTYKFEVFV